MSFRARILCVPLAALCLCLTACGDYTNIEELMVISGIGLELTEDGGYLCTAEIAKASTDSSKGPVESRIVENEGRSLPEAVLGLVTQLSGRIYLRHISLLVLDEELARQGAMDVIDTSMRTPQFQSTTLIAVSKDCKAGDVLRQKSESNSLISKSITNSVQQQQEFWGKTVYTKVYEAYNAAEDGGAMILPAIRLKEEGGKTVADADGVAILDDVKLKGFLEPDESQYLLIAAGTLKNGNVNHTDSRDGEEIDLRISELGRSLSPYVENGSAAMHVHLDLSGVIIDTQGKKLTMSTPGDDALVLEMEESMAAHVESAILKLQREFGADVLGFAPAMQGKYRAWWKEIGGEEGWPEYFRSLPVSVSVKMDIRNSGIAQ